MNILYIDTGLKNEEGYADSLYAVKALVELGHTVSTRMPVEAQEGTKNALLYEKGIVIRGEHEDPLELRKYAKELILWNWEQPGVPYLTKEKLDSYDYIFNSSKANDEWVSKRTDTPCRWLTQPIDPTVFKPLDIPKEVDILYAGTYSPIRWNWIMELSKHFKVAVIGNGWNEQCDNLTGKDFNDACNKCRICLTLPSWASPNFKGTNLDGRHYSLRNMMYLASGAVTVVHGDQYEFSDLFKDTTGLFYYADLENCVSLIRSLLRKGNKVTNTMWKEIHEKYTYKVIMEKMLNDINYM